MHGVGRSAIDSRSLDRHVHASCLEFVALCRLPADRPRVPVILIVSSIVADNSRLRVLSLLAKGEHSSAVLLHKSCCHRPTPPCVGLQANSLGAASVHQITMSSHNRPSPSAIRFAILASTIPTQQQPPTPPILSRVLATSHSLFPHCRQLVLVLDSICFSSPHSYLLSPSILTPLRLPLRFRHSATLAATTNTIQNNLLSGRSFRPPAPNARAPSETSPATASGERSPRRGD